MSKPQPAHDRLRNVLLSNGWAAEQVDEWLNERDAEHARELAQQQRNWDAATAGYTEPQMAVYAVADLIDPTVADED